MASGFTALGILLVLVQIRDVRRTRDAQITIDISRRWDEEPLVSARLKVNKLGTDQAVCSEILSLQRRRSREYYELLSEPNYFEDLGILCESGALNRGMIRESFGALVAKRYDRWKLAVDELRKADADNYKHFEDLAEEMRTNKESWFRGLRRRLAARIAP